jgi:4-methyl-5(b-hydroxyethyl)-thiazole monophosphate biosynthesis
LTPLWIDLILGLISAFSKEAAMSRRVLLPISTGFEEIEAVTIIDILRRAGAEVTVAALDGAEVTGRSAITVIPDTSLDDALANGPYDLMVLPGGLPNAYTLRDDPRIIDGLKKTLDDGGRVGAICAAPVALEKAGLLADTPATSFPAMQKELESAKYSEDRVVVSGRIATSRSAGTAMEFAFALVRELFGADKVNSVNTGVLARL